MGSTATAIAPAREAADLLKGVPALLALSGEQRAALAERCELASFPAGARVCAVDQEWDGLYIVLAGSARLVNDRSPANEVPLDVLSQGAFFGEQSLLDKGRGPYSVYSLGDLTLLSLSRRSFHAFLDRDAEARQAIARFQSQDAARSLLAVSQFFSVLEPEQFALLVDSLKPRELKAGQWLIRENDLAREMYIVEKGRLRVFRDAEPDKTIAVVERGNVVGEMALMNGARRNANVVAETAGSVFVLPGDVFQALLKDQKKLAASMAELVERRRSAAGQPAVAAVREGVGSPASAEPTEVRDTLEWEDTSFRPPASLGYRLGRFPAVRQQSQMDCGAACLATVCRYYGKPLSLNRLRELARVGRAGASMLNLLRAAQSLGFETKPVLATFDHLRRNHLPALVNWNGYHWVVVHRVTDSKVTVADPGQGLLHLTHEQFLAGWTRYTLYLRPTARFAEVPESPPTLEQFKPYIRPYRRVLLEIGIASLAIQILALVLPLFTRFILDEVILSSDQRWLTTSLVVMSAVVALSLSTTWLRQKLLLFVSLRINLQLLRDFYRHVLSLPLPFFESRKVGDTLRRFEENAKISDFFTHTGIDFFIDSITAVLYLGLMFYFNVPLTLVALLFLFFHLVNVYSLTPYLQQAYRDSFQKSAEVQSHLVEALTGLRTVKILAIEHFVRWTWENLFIRATNAYFKTLKYGIVSGLAGQLVNHAGSVAVLFYGAWKVLDKQMTVGELVAFTVLFQQMTAPLTKLVKSWETLQETLNAVERLNDVYETPPEVVTEGEETRVVLHALRGHVRFENLTFRYDPEGRNVLQNLSLEVQPGQRVAFVGRSGSGKSTLVKLLLGFYRPTSGRIVVDGFDVQGVYLPSFRKLTGVVPQESFLLRGTVRENISLAVPDASLADVVRAAQLAAADDFIRGLPQGYETMLEEQASNLSGGQRQRIAIARAVLQNPQLLMLDEATSALDNESERIFLRHLEKVFQGRTIFSIAHRLSTVRNADLIVVLDHGNIIEQGNHDQLTAERGMYYFLSTQQLNL